MPGRSATAASGESNDSGILLTMAAAAIPDEAKCLDCNYALRGISEFRCPECGRPFDPERPLSVNLGRPLGQFARLVLRPMGRLPRVVMWALVVVGVMGPAWLVPDEVLACLWLLLWGAFFTACWARSTARVLVVRIYMQPRILLRLDDTFRRKVRRAFLCSTVLVLTRLPFLLSILLSRPWLDPYAYHAWADIPAVMPLPAEPVMRGAVVVRRVDMRDGRVVLEFYGGGGIAYLPSDDGRLRLDRWSWNRRWRDVWDLLTS